MLKFKKIFILNIAMILLIMGCASQTDKANSQPTDNITDEIFENVLKDDYYAGDIYDSEGGYKDGFVFIYNDMPIYLGEYSERILTEFEPVELYEYQSCSFDGIAKIYYYDDFEFSTYLNDKSDRDRIYSIELYDAATAEKICTGHTFYDMIAQYGIEYEELQASALFYRYTKGGTILSFGIEDDIIISILYQVEDMYD